MRLSGTVRFGRLAEDVNSTFLKLAYRVTVFFLFDISAIFLEAQMHISIYHLKSQFIGVKLHFLSNLTRKMMIYSLRTRIYRPEIKSEKR